ncbi:MAG: hypothetical protein ACJ8F1_25670 [Polyangia bacterium]
MRRLAVLVVLAASGAGCMDADQPLSERGGAVGEPTNGFPSAIERLGLMAINRARSDPQTVKGPSSATYPARPPVIWSLPLNQSSRFHAMNLRLSDVTLMHDSPCPLKTDVGTSGCNGDPSCACATPVGTACAMCGKVAATNNGCGTPVFTRLGYFVAGTTVKVSGEVAAAGYADPIATVNGWMDEAAGDDGHRKNLTDQGVTSNTMGYGRASGMPACFSSFDVSDSGNIMGAVIPKIPTAAVSPASGNAGTYTFYATWADPAHGAPASLSVVLDGACVTMTRELGTDTLNATYKVTAPLAAGCHQYAIAGTDATGAAAAYPTTGMLTISVGNMACSADFVAGGAASCSADGGPSTGTGATGGAAAGASGAGTGGAATGGAGGRSTTGAGGRTGAGGSATGGATGSGGSAGSGGSGQTGGAGGAASGGGGGSSGCSCEVGRRGTPAGMAWLFAAGLAILLRRRARHARGRGLCQAGGTAADVQRT